jgi:sirohydrochlorin ferrochelatase
VTTDTKEAVIDWLKQQGVSTVLLIALLTFAGYAVTFLVPQHITLIKDGYKEMAESHEATVQKVIDSHDKDRQMFIEILNGRSLVKQ